MAIDDAATALDSFMRLVKIAAPRDLRHLAFGTETETVLPPKNPNQCGKDHFAFRCVFHFRKPCKSVTRVWYYLEGNKHPYRSTKNTVSNI